MHTGPWPGITLVSALVTLTRWSSVLIRRSALPPELTSMKEKAEPVHHQVAGMNHIGLAPVERGIAIGMPAAGCDRVDPVSIEMKADTIFIGDHRERCGWSRGCGEACNRGACSHPHAHIVMRDDRHPGLAEVLVPAAVVEMPVGVDEIFHRLCTQRGNCGEDLVGQRANWSSISTVPSSPWETPIFPPAPNSTATPGATASALISTFSKSVCASTGAAQANIAVPSASAANFDLQIPSRCGEPKRAGRRCRVA